MSLAPMARKAWLCVFCTIGFFQIAYCANPGQGGCTPLGDFQKKMDDAVLKAKGWGGDFIMTFLERKSDDLSGKDSLEFVLRNLANIAYLQFAFKEEDSKISIFKGELEKIRGLERSSAVKEVNRVFGEYYDFMVGLLKSLLNKYLYKLPDGFRFSSFEDIAKLKPDEFKELLWILSNNLGSCEEIAADAIGGESKLFSTYFSEFMGLIVDKYKEFDSDVREALDEISSLRLEDEGFDEETGGNPGDYGALETREEEIKNWIEQKQLVIDEIIENGDRKGYENEGYLDTDFYETIKNKLSEIFDEDMVSNMLLPSGYVADLVLYVKKNLSVFANYAKKHAEYASSLGVEELVDRSMEFVDRFAGSGLNRFHKKIIKCGNEAEKVVKTARE